MSQLPASQSSMPKKRSKSAERGAKRVSVAGPVTPASFSGGGLIRQKLTFALPMNTSAGGLLDNSYVNIQNPSSGEHWASYIAMYDQYRVRYIKVRYVPSWNISTYGAAGTPQNVPMVVFMDTDSLGTAIVAYTFKKALSYDNAAVHETARGFTKTFKCPIPAQSVLGRPSGWLDTSVTLPTVGAIGFILNSTCNVASALLGTVIVTMDVEFKNHS